MATMADGQKTAGEFSPRQWAQVIFVYMIIPLILFVCAGDLTWWQAWVFAVIIIFTGVASRLFAERRHPGLMVERVASFYKVENVKPWDKVLAPLMAVSVSFPLVIVAGLDHRYQWSAAFPVWATILGLVLIALGYAFASWALRENPFFSGTVHIQAGHTVCDSGPYRIVRHPGYAGNILPLFGIVLALNSAWTLIPALAALVIILIRTSLEDRTLQAELPGYKEYARRVRYRLVPGVY